MSDIVEFLRARFDDDERLAKAATPGPWVALNHRYGASTLSHWVLTAESIQVGVPENPIAAEVQIEANAEHIAHHSPQRVIREVTAKRQILALHAPVLSPSDGPTPRVTICAACGPTIDDLYSTSPDNDHYPCDTMRYLAIAYGDNLGYDPAWRP
jgi:hypothetical protein